MPTRTGNYAWHEDEEEGYTFNPYPMTVHYYLETFSVTGIPTINMRTDTLTFKGTAGNDVLYGLDSRDDIIMGLNGNDTLWGNAGNDTLIGGSGRDALYGGAGDDAYVFGYNFSSGVGFGYDAISENPGDGTDTIRFIDGIEASEVYFWTDMYGYLWFQVGEDANNNTLMVLGSTSGAGVLTRVERVEFDDSTVWDLTQGLHLRNNDTGRSLYGSAVDDWILGGVGNDTLWGYGGDDTLVGGGGTNLLIGGAGADTYMFLASDVGSGVSTISGFSLVDNDVIDLRDVLSAYDPLTDILSDYVQFSSDGWGGTNVNVDIDGSLSGHSWTQIATLQSLSFNDPSALAISGHLLVT